MRRMQIGMTYRLFFVILTAAVLAVLAVFPLSRWGFMRGVEQYIDTLEQATVIRLMRRLEERYAAQGSWDFLRNDPDTWDHIIAASLPAEELGGEDLVLAKMPKGRPTGKAEAHPRHFLLLQLDLHIEARAVLLDADHAPLLGQRQLPTAMSFQPLRYRGQVVGYLGLFPREQPFTPPKIQFFLRQQLITLGLAAGAVILVAAALSFPLARRLVRPIRTLATATHRLAAGQFETRVPVTSSDEVGQLARDFNALALTLEKNNQVRRQWVADISHELRTPLAVLRGEIEALQDGIRPPTPDAFRSLHSEVIRLGRLADDLHQLALSDLGALTYRKVDLNLTALLADAAASYLEAFTNARIALTVDVAQVGQAMIFGDPQRLHQLFTNLLDNSLKYTDPGGALTVRLECHDGQALLDFQDSAPGVPDHELDRLFDPLFRVEASRNRATAGAGLGLAICRNIAEAHAGHITARPSPRTGLWIRIMLPLTAQSV